MRAKVLIEEYYGTQRASRSGVPLINHIYEGVEWLDYICADVSAIEAFYLHPMIQHESDLQQNWSRIASSSFSPRTIMFLMEYRNIANLGLRPFNLPDPFYPQTSPIPAVNDMLRADKIQNRKDFDLYNKGILEASDDLTRYFAGWFTVLGIGDKMYERAVEIMTLRTEGNKL